MRSEIPQDVLEMATRFFNDVRPGGSVVDRIARAIVAAKAEQREADAKVADRRAAMAATVSHPAAVALLQALPDAIRGTPQ